MKITLITVALVSLTALIGCSGSKSPEENSAHLTGSSTSIKEIEEEIPPYEMDTLLGIYKGDFGGSPINIILTYVNKNKVVGYNIHRGLQRNISGDVSETRDEVILKMAEPGDHDFDGVFEIRINKNDLKGKGVWTANNKQYGERKFSLKKHIVSENEEQGKFVEHATTITEKNFIEYFGGSTSEDGDFDFTEDGLVIFHYFPDKSTGQYRKQEVTIRGNWEFGKKDRINVSWEKNTYFKKPEGYFQITYDPEYGYPGMKIEGHELNPLY